MPRSWAVTAIAARATIVSDAKERRAKRAARRQRDERAAVKPISRILSDFARLAASFVATTIPLARPSLAGSSNLPGDLGRAALKRLPIWSCSVRGFACHFCCQKRGALLPHHFTLTHDAPDSRDAVHLDGVAADHLRSGPDSIGSHLIASTRRAMGGIFSVPLFRQVTLPGRYPAHCPLEFGLSSLDRASPPAVTRRRGLDRQRSSGLAAALSLMKGSGIRDQGSGDPGSGIRDGETSSSLRPICSP